MNNLSNFEIIPSLDGLQIVEVAEAEISDKTKFPPGIILYINDPEAVYFSILDMLVNAGKNIPFGSNVNIVVDEEPFKVYVDFYFGKPSLAPVVFKAELSISYFEELLKHRNITVFFFKENENREKKLFNKAIGFQITNNLAFEMRRCFEKTLEFVFYDLVASGVKITEEYYNGVFKTFVKNRYIGGEGESNYGC